MPRGTANGERVTLLRLIRLWMMMMGLYIPSYLEEVAPDNPVLQVRLARAMRVLEKETRRCYKCHQQGHLQKRLQGA